MTNEIKEMFTAILGIQLIVFSGMFGLIIRLLVQQGRIEKENAVNNAVSAQAAKDTHQLLEVVIGNTSKKFDEQGNEINKLDHRVTTLELDHAKYHK
jgi:hypothetical protein